MSEAKAGDTVKINYEAKLTDGRVFDAAYKQEPFEFTLGGGQVIQGLEQAILGMQPGESKTALVTSDQAFGPHMEAKVVEMERSSLPETLELEAGKQFQGRNPDGSLYFVTVKDVSEAKVTVDTNHPLAGQDLIFDVKLVEIA